MASKCASKTLFVGNLHASLEETDLLEIFKPFGRIVECCKRWCHYGFIQFATEDEAKLAFNNLNGSRVRGRPMRIEFQRKKIRNLAALLEAEAQTKQNTQVNFTLDDRTSPLQAYEDTENISPNMIKCGDSGNNENFKFSFSFSTNTPTTENQLVSQFAFMEELEHATSTQPLATRNMNIIKSQQSNSITKNVSFDDFSNDNSIAKEIANSVLMSSSAKKPQKPLKSQDFDNKSTAWFNYLLDKAAQVPSVRGGSYKINQDISESESSSASSPRSPIHHRSDYQVSPNVKNLSSNNGDNSSIVLYRSLNTSNTIFVQPTDILEPLEIGDFNEYKLFPQTSSKEEFYTFMSSPNHKNTKNTVDIDLLVELTPPSSVSLSSSCSDASSSDSSTSPLMRVITNKTNRRRLATQKLFSEN